MRLSIPAPLVSPLQRVHRFVPLAAAESLFITLFALVISLVLFGLFVMFAGANPLSVFHSMYVGSFGTSFSIQNTLARAAPLMLTGLCVALPLRLGMVIIGGEGALALGGLAAAMIGHAMNGSKPFVVIACILCYILMNHSVIGFAANVVGGNARAAKLAGISIARLTLLVCFLAGAAAGLTGMVEVAAVQGRANDNIICGYGYAGILVAFLARGNPLAIIPVALLLGGVQASGGVIQRREHLSDACVAVFQGIIFLTILASESSYGRYKIFQRKET